MDYASVAWRNGQPYSEDFDDVYYSVNNGKDESEYVFLQHNELRDRFASAEKFVIAETGFGTGLNFALTLYWWQKYAPASAQLDYIGIEFAPLSPDDIRRVAATWPGLEVYFNAWLSQYPLPVAGRHMCYLPNQRVRLHLCFMDVCAALQHESLAVDAWYLDGFAPAKNPQIWNHRVFTLMAQNSARNATVATYSAAGFVRRGLEQAGFNVVKRKGHGNKREMITAQFLTPASTPAPGPPWYQVSHTPWQSKHAVVLGAGLAGLCVAWSLIRRGWRITLVDQHSEVAGEASGNPVGLVLPRLSVDDSRDVQFYRTAFLHAVTALDALQARFTSTANDSLFWHKQGVYCGMKTSRAERMLQRCSFNPAFIQHVTEDVSKMALPVDTRLLFVPGAGWASPRQLCQIMHAACGDELQYCQADVSRLQQVEHGDGFTWQCLSATGQGVAEAEVLVLANGINATQFQQTRWLPIRSARGQLTELAVRQEISAPDLACSFEHYLAPFIGKDRSYICGASYHLDDSCEVLREADQLDNVAFAEKIYPGVFEPPLKLQGRTGFRAVSDDRLPLVGPVADIAWFEQEYNDLCHGRPEQGYQRAHYLPGLYASTGHGSRGMTSCFISAEMIAAQIEGTPLPLAQELVDLVNPARFIIRRLKRGG